MGDLSVRFLGCVICHEDAVPFQAVPFPSSLGAAADRRPPPVTLCVEGSAWEEGEGG